MVIDSKVHKTRIKFDIANFQRWWILNKADNSQRLPTSWSPCDKAVLEEENCNYGLIVHNHFKEKSSNRIIFYNRPQMFLRYYFTSKLLKRNKKYKILYFLFYQLIWMFIKRSN